MTSPGVSITSVDATDGAVVVGVPHGGLGAATLLHLELERLTAAGARRCVVDVREALPLDLTVVGVLLAGLRRLNDVDGQLVLLAPCAEARLVDEDSIALGLHFQVEGTLPAALAAAARGPHQ